MARVADLIACQLRVAGVRALFGVPGGGSNLDLIEAAGRAGLPFVLTSTETAAAIAALAQAEITGQPGACLTTLGPGATSAVNGVACAYLDRVPLVVFTDSHPAMASAFEHQRIDQRALFGPITKSSEAVTADDATEVMVRAIQAATEGCPGPVHIDCPGDVAAALATADGLSAGSASQLRTTDGQAEMERLLAGARKPMLLVGLGARRPADVEAIRSFCE